jgi:protoheme IX farnesyltransferase
LTGYLELTKPRVTSLVLVTTLAGFYLGSAGGIDWVVLLHALLGTALVAAGTSALNMYVEREADGKMLRTRLRPLPSGRMAPRRALLFAVAISWLGLTELLAFVNPLTALLAAVTLATYVFVYTPMKTASPLCTLVGAIPGALPPLIGWTAARGAIGAEGLSLFAILFVWQMPHSLAIAMMYRDDYARGGFRLLPVVDPLGGSTERQILLHSLVLLPVSLMPAILRLSGTVYFYGALALGVGFAALALAVALRSTARAARRVLLGSVVYLPALLALMAFDRLTPLRP